MKAAFIFIFLVITFCSFLPPPPLPLVARGSAENLIVVVIDGFRWQEMFGGADPRIINDTVATREAAMLRLLYDAETSTQRRELLLPFFWKVIAREGQLIGNRRYGSKMNTSNLYQISYPGYHEMFTGNTDLLISSNKKLLNPHGNVMEYLQSLQGFSGKVVAFTSWDVFPFILNEDRSGVLVNSGFEPVRESSSNELNMLDRLQLDTLQNRTGTRYDELTFIAAREYMALHRPRVMLLGLGETDEYAHQGRYDLYLHHANKIDRMLAELWYWIQQTPGYAGNTSLLVTTDHGRGRRSGNWKSHGTFIGGSSETWMAMMGPGIEQAGEMKKPEQHFQWEIAGLIAEMVGRTYPSGKYNR